MNSNVYLSRLRVNKINITCIVITALIYSLFNTISVSANDDITYPAMIKLDDDSVVWANVDCVKYIGIADHSVLLSDSSIVVAGTTKRKLTKETWDVWVKCIDKNGTLKWSYLFADEHYNYRSSGICKDDNDNIYLAADKADIGNQKAYGWACKINRLGELLWENSFDYNKHNTSFKSISYMPSMGAVVTGAVWFNKVTGLLGAIDGNGKIKYLTFEEAFPQTSAYWAAKGNDDCLIVTGHYYESKGNESGPRSWIGSYSELGVKNWAVKMPTGYLAHGPVVKTKNGSLVAPALFRKKTTSEKESRELTFLVYSALGELDQIVHIPDAEFRNQTANSLSATFADRIDNYIYIATNKIDYDNEEFVITFYRLDFISNEFASRTFMFGRKIGIKSMNMLSRSECIMAGTCLPLLRNSLIDIITMRLKLLFDTKHRFEQTYP